MGAISLCHVFPFREAKSLARFSAMLRANYITFCSQRQFYEISSSLERGVKSGGAKEKGDEKKEEKKQEKTLQLNKKKIQVAPLLLHPMLQLVVTT